MSPNRKALIAFISFFLVLVTIACSCSSIIPTGGATTPANNPQGATGGGSPGTSAPQEESGSSFIEQSSVQVDIPAGQTGTATATCPSGSLRLGGGFTSGQGIKITATMPIDPAGWLVAGLNSTSDAISLTVYSYCLHNAAGTVRVVSESVAVSGAPFAHCQNGEIVTGGGFADDTGILNVYISTPIGDSIDPNNAWSVMANSSQNADQPIHVFAVCLSKSKVTSTLVRDNQVDYGPQGNSLDFTLSCPAGAVMASGGYEGTGVYTNRVSANDAGMWEIQVQGKNFFDGSLDHAVCLTLP